MANPNKPSGFSPVGHLLGLNWNGKGRIYSIDSANASAFYPGDPVKLSGTGDTKGIPGIVLGTAGATCLGIVQAVGVTPDGGPYADPNNLNIINAPATKTKNYYALVLDDPFIIWEVQEGGAGTILTAAVIGENIDFLAGSPATGVNVSGFTIDNANHDTTSTRNFKILGLARRIDNTYSSGAIASSPAKWWGVLNNHVFRAGVTGV